MNPWSEKEVKATVREYFKLLKAEIDKTPVIKAEIYRKLSKEFSNRSPGAFESKFQNISAVLYNQHLPYCSGLKPRMKYQKLLELVVLDYLDRSPLPTTEPKDILFTKLRELKTNGSIPVTGNGSGRFGLALEKALGIPPNSNKAPDFMGIELKTKTGNTLQTLFSKVPSRYKQDIDRQSMFNRHSYFDTKKSRRALNTSFSSKPDSLGFSLKVDDRIIKIIRRRTLILEYDSEKLEESLLKKHMQTAYLSLIKNKNGKFEEFSLDCADYCQSPSINNFLRLTSEGEMFLDFTMAETPKKRIKDHGFLWRIRSNTCPRLYLHSETVDLDAA